jgi:peptidoglycan/xylan/chitin deacetylase (PgdA/CDA1 family)
MRMIARLGRRIGFRRTRGDAVILLYHRVNEPRSAHDKLSVSPTHFADQIEEIHRRLQPISLPSLVEAIGNRSVVRGSVAITFDDGYADNLVEARPVLARHDVPATVFVVSGYVGSERRFWWDELEEIVFRPATLPSSPELSVVSPGADRRPLYRALRERLGSLEGEERDELLDRLRREALGNTVGAAETLSVDQLQGLADGELIEIGAHTVSHPRLPSLPPSRQLDEIAESRRQLEAMLGRSVRLFSYPFGEHDRVTVRSAKAAGVACACTTTSGSVRASSDRYRLHRLTVGDWPADELMERISALMN